jgi:tol-pal system protein YbgF
LLSLAGLAVGCGSPAAAEPSSASSSGDEVAVAAAAECDDDDTRVHELESRLAMSTAEIRSLRTQLREARARADLAQRSVTDITTVPIDDEEEVAESGSRPVLRLYGAGPSIAPAPITPEMPSITATPQLARLPVVLTPGAPDSVPAIPIEPPSAPPADDSVVIEYRAALAHVSAREWDAALASLASFVAAHPDHAYADNAMYWRGEVLYARRDYAGAITELAAMVERFPHGNKVPDALLRIGFAYERLGEPARAREMFQRVRDEYPGTVAARTASREDV